MWGYDFDPLTNVVDVLVSRLRNKVDREFDKKVIQTHGEWAMPSRILSHFHKSLGFRLSFWYSVIFIQVS